MCFLFPCQLTFIFHLSYQLILRFRWIRFVTNSFEVHTQPNPPPPHHTTPLQRNKTKTLRSYKCKPVILLVSLTNGTTDGIFPLHFNLEYVLRSFYLLASISCRCERGSARHNSFPLRRRPLRGLHCGLVMIFNYTDASIWGVKGRWGSLEDQRFRPEEDFCVLADAFSQDAPMNSASGHTKPISRPRAVCVGNRGAGKSAISESLGLWDINDKNIHFAFLSPPVLPCILR